MGIWGEEEWKWEPRWRKELFVWEQQQLQQLQRALSQVCIRKTSLDSWIWATDPSSTFTVKLAYSDLHNLRFPREVDETSDNVWKLQIPRKVTRCIWRMVLNRLPTCDNLLIRSIEVVDSLCVFCHQHVDSVEL